MEYPNDKFYSGHSLSFDLGRSGKKEYLLMRDRLIKLGFKPKPETTSISLLTVKVIQKLIKNNAKIEQKKILLHLRKNQITGDVIPIDISMAYEIFGLLLLNLPIILKAGNISMNVYDTIKRLKSKIKKQKSKNVIDDQTNKTIIKILEKDSKNIVINNITNIVINYTDKPKSKRKTKNKKKTKK